MATLATGQPPPGVVQPPSNPSNISPPLNLLQTNPQTQNPSYKSIIHSNAEAVGNIAIPAPIFDLHHGEPSFVWEDKIVDVMMRHEELHYAVIGKFSYGMPEFHELRKQIPLQCEIKGECLIGFLETRHVVIRLSFLEDYVHLLSRPAFSLKVGANLYPMRTMKYDVWFDPREETSIAVAWISFPGLPPAFFVKDAVFALASAVGKPLQLDAATKSKTRPSCAKVKVEVDLIATKPQRLRIGIKNSSNGEIRYKWIRIRYDFLPKYCKVCRLQGHNEEECFSLHPELVSVEEVKAKEDHFSKNEAVKAAPFKVLQSGKIVGNVFKEGEGVAPVQTQGRQGKNSNKYLHPNRNPKAWTRVENKSKQVSIDTARLNQGETVVTSNAFAMLDVVVGSRDDDHVATDTQQADGGKQKSHVQESTDAAHINQVDELHAEIDKSEKIQHKDANLIQHAVVDDASHIVVNSVPEVEKASTVAMDSTVLVAKDLGDLPEGGTRSWVREVFKTHPKVDAVGVSVKSGSGLRRADLNGHAVGVSEVNAVSLSIEAGGQAVRKDDLDLSFNSSGAEGVVAEGLKVSGAFNIPVSYGIKVAQKPSAFLNDAALILDNKVHGINMLDIAVESRGKGLEVEGILNAEGGAIVQQPSALIVHGNGLNSNAGREGGVTQHPSAMLLDKMVSPSLIKNKTSAVDSRGEEQPFPNVYGNPCEIKEKSADLIVVESRGDDSFTDSRGNALIPLNIVPSDFIKRKPSAFEHVHDALGRDPAGRAFKAKGAQYGSACGIREMSDGLINSRGEEPSAFITSRIDAALESRAAVHDPHSKAEAELSKPLHVADRVMGFNSQAFDSPSLRCGSHDAAPNETVWVSSEDEDVPLSQRTCVENKLALTIPSFEVNTSLESVSVTKPKLYDKDLIPTVQLERLCRSTSPNFGDSFLNINAPSFVPKSLMQLVPHLKYLPTDDELVKRMDLKDTRGILERQVGSLQERFPQRHYLVEDDDLFEEEEFDEESTAHNFSMVARAGDLSPRDIRANTPKRVRMVRRPLEPTRVQPSRSTKSKSKRSNKSKNSKK